MKDQKLAVGDRIIDSDQIYVIFKIENNRIFYRPMEGKNNRGDSSGSIPINNLSQACIRPLMTKLEVKLFWENLIDEKPMEVPQTTSMRNNNGVLLKEVLYLNNPAKTSRLLIYLSILGKDSKVSTADQLIFDQALNHLADEISVVLETPVDKVKEKILSTIKR